MVVCKIMIDFDEPKADFNKFMKEIGKIGDVQCEPISGSVYFATEGEPTKKDIKGLLSQCGFEQAFLLEYSKDKLPSNEGEYLGGWLLDHIVKNAEKQFNKEHKKELANVSRQITTLTEKIRADSEEAKKEKTKEGVNDNGATK